jgi:hypothetical protein
MERDTFTIYQSPFTVVIVFWDVTLRKLVDNCGGRWRQQVPLNVGTYHSDFMALHPTKQ